MVNAKPFKTLAVLTAVVLALAITILLVDNSSQNLTACATVKASPNIGVYSDSACTHKLTLINWGSVAAGKTAAQTVYVKNTGTATITLSLAASSWSPPTASTYLTVSWNQQGTKLTAGKPTAAKITLTVASTIKGFTTFSNAITITGTG
ncbi:MAG: hypothetical protein ABSG33_11935 [Candidatus Bathyarchaeia archaeon]